MISLFFLPIINPRLSIRVSSSCQPSAPDSPLDKGLQHNKEGKGCFPGYIIIFCYGLVSSSPCKTPCYLSLVSTSNLDGQFPMPKQAAYCSYRYLSTCSSFGNWRSSNQYFRSNSVHDIYV